jgi:uncharacterized protein
MMTMRNFSAALRAAAIGAALLALGNVALAQPKPSAASLETAKEIIAIKGGDNLFGSLIPGMIEQGKAMFEQQNPALGKDLAIVAAKLRTDLAPRMAEVNSEVAKAYASHFSEAELKDMLAFYKSPLGRKMISEEPKALQESMVFAQEWSRKFSDEVLSNIRAEMKKMGHDL